MSKRGTLSHLVDQISVAVLLIMTNQLFCEN